MKPPRQLVIEVCRAPMGNPTVRVLLPADDRAKWLAKRDLDELVEFGFVSQQVRDTFLADLEYLPATEAQLAAADAMHGAGVNWHDSAARSRGLARCNCSMCVEQMGRR